MPYINCNHCGVEFYTTNGCLNAAQKRGRKRFCSRACCAESKKASIPHAKHGTSPIKRKGRRSDRSPQPYKEVGCYLTWTDRGAQRGAPIYAVVCDICGEPAGVRTSSAINRTRRQGSKIVCSPKCRRDPKFDKVCKTCGKQFRSNDTAKKGSGTFCSQACYAVWQRGPENCGKNNPTWKEGTEDRSRTKRPEYRRWRTGIFERDKYTCQICGKVGERLHAHHIKPYRLYPELELSPGNGATLCVSCHRQLHKETRRDEYPIAPNQVIFIVRNAYQ